METKTVPLYDVAPHVCLRAMAQTCRFLETDIEIGVLDAVEAENIYHDLCLTMRAPYTGLRFIPANDETRSHLRVVRYERDGRMIQRLIAEPAGCDADEALYREFWTEQSRQSALNAYRLHEWRQKRDALNAAPWPGEEGTGISAVWLQWRHQMRGLLAALLTAGLTAGVLLLLGARWMGWLR